MFENIIAASIRHRVLVLLCSLGLVVAGSYAFIKLPLDAVPDVTNVQVQVLTPCPSLGTIDVERVISTPIERALTGLKGLSELRSLSRQGVSAVTIVFDDDIDPYFARAQVAERLPRLRDLIPPSLGIPELGPMTTGLGEIYQFEVRGEKTSKADLRTLLDWEIAPKLRMVPGIVEVNTFGGELKTYEVAVDPDRMRAARVALEDVVRALPSNNALSGGGIIQRGPEGVLVRGEALIHSLTDLGGIVVASRNGSPVFIRDVAEVRFSAMPKLGAATRDGRGEILVGMAMMLSGGNSREVAKAVSAKVDDINEQLPHGIHIEPFYDRTALVNLTIKTVSKNLLEGAALVIIVLLLLLRNLRAGIIAAAVIPLSMLGAAIGMRLAGVSGNLMSLGAIDFGLVVDAAIILLENAIVKLSEARLEHGCTLSRTKRDAVVLEAALEVRSATAFGELLIAVVYLPVLTLVGVEGRMFRPMALTVLFALGTAFVLSLTFVPALASMLLSGDTKESQSPLMDRLKSAYRQVLIRTLKHPIIIAALATLAIVISVWKVTLLGTEFIPRLDEGTLVIEVNRPPATSIVESVRQSLRIEKTLKKFREVDTVVTKTGRPEVANDPMGPEQSDVYVILKPESRWSPQKERERMIDKMSEALRETLPGTTFGFSQPIEMRMNELLSGVRSDFAIKIYGADLQTLTRLGKHVSLMLGRVRGSRDIRMDRLTGMPTLRFDVDRSTVAQRNTESARALLAIEALTGVTAGMVLEGDRRFALRVRWLEPFDARWNATTVARLPVATNLGDVLPLADIVRITNTEEPTVIQHEATERRIIVQSNVRSRDLGSFASEALRLIAERVNFPAGYRMEIGGQIKNLEEAKVRFLWVIPAALLLVVGLLFWTFNSALPAILILLNIPFAATGGVAALAIRGLSVSISAAVGFIAVMGVAVLNGMVLLSHIRDLEQSGRDVEGATVDGALRRLRPIMTTALVASLGFFPMAIATGAGAEVQRPLATVVIGGLITSTFLTLFVLPTLYLRLSRPRKSQKEPQAK